MSKSIQNGVLKMEDFKFLVTVFSEISLLMDYYFWYAWPTERSREGEKGLKISFAQICLRYFPYFMPVANEKFCRANPQDPVTKERSAKLKYEKGRAYFQNVKEKRKKIKF